MNPILNTDSYKLSHYLQYPPGTEYVSSYIEARKGDRVMFFGLQAYLLEYLSKPITLEHILEAKEVATAHGLPFNLAGWMHILNTHNGILPISVQAIPEGTVTASGNALVQIVNTDPKVPWLTSYLETSILRAVWYPSTVATVSYEIKNLIRRYLNKTGDVGGLPFKLHDFGARGVSSAESATLGGLGHLVNFKGTDTLSAIIGARRYYAESMAGFSIPAAEHNTITSWGRESERSAFKNMVEQFGHGLYAVVSDSYDLFAAINDLWGTELKDQVINAGGTLVVRPDSGVPHVIVLKTVQALEAKFGSTTNDKGYKVLPSCIRVIQGDGINIDSINDILAELEMSGYSADNIAFGMGGALLQQPNRDTFSFAMKASAINMKGYWHDVMKDPVTDSGKRSKPGRLAVVRTSDGYRTVPQTECPAEANMLREVWRNGHLLRFQTFAEIRETADA